MLLFNIVTFFNDLMSRLRRNLLRPVELRTRRAMPFRSLQHLIMRRRLVFVVVGLAIIFTHWKIFEFVPHQNAAQIGMSVEINSVEIENFALLKLRAPPNWRQRRQPRAIRSI